MNGTRTAIGTAAAWAVLAALTALAAGCGSAPPSSGASPPATTPASTAAASEPATASASTAATSEPAAASAPASAARFVGIVEPWDPGHPARPQTAWLKAREPVCAVAFHTGGSIDGINIGACLLDESTARLDGVKGIAPPEATLKSTDNFDPDALSWYTTPEGSRVAELDTQGDQSGGGIIAWIIIGGADGFVVNPRQFYFTAGSFTDPGVVQPPNPTYHRVGTGQQYQFLIDYSHLSGAPTGSPVQGFVYAPGTPAAIWR